MPEETQIAVFGGGVAGLAAALALASAGKQVTVYEARAFLGGRATSYPLNAADDQSTVIDNCQHILLRCCHNLLDFYKRLGVHNQVTFYREFYWMEPGGRTSVMKRGLLPAPAHFTESFAALKFLSLADKLAVARGLLAVRAEYAVRKDLDEITMLQWLREKKQTQGAINRFWHQVLVSAVNEELDAMAARHGLQVFYLGFLAGADNYQMGLPNVPLVQLYGPDAWRKYPNVQFQFRASLNHLHSENGRVQCASAGEHSVRAQSYILALPFDRLASLAPGLEIDYSDFTHVPITGIHLWFDRPITSLPHITFLDRTIHWLYNKDGGKHVQTIVSASRSLTKMSREQVIELVLIELSEFLPIVKEAKLERAHVVKEMRATFSAKPGLESKRPTAATKISNLFLAGDWTKSGWPSTMEGAVRSGYRAAEAVLQAEGNPQSFLLHDQR